MAGKKPNKGKKPKRDSFAEGVVRENVLRFERQSGRPRVAIAKAAGIDPSRFSRFLLGKGGVTMDELFDLATALDTPVRSLVSFQGKGEKELRKIPALYLHEYPPIADPSEAPEKLIDFKHRWHETYEADPRAFAVDLLEPFEDCRKGDVLTFSDSEPARLPPIVDPLPPGQRPPKEIILVGVDSQTALGTYLEIDGKPAVQLASGEVRTDFKYRGRMIKLERDT